MIYTCTIDTPLEPMTAAADNEALTGLWFIGQKYYPERTADWSSEPARPVFDALRNYLTRYFSGDSVLPDIRLAPEGSPFQKEVWAILTQIPVGRVTTYGTIAKHLARKRGFASISAQSVGGAVGHNPITILIPCHRVIGADGSLTGYAGGLDRKAALLKIEKMSAET